MNSQRDDKPKQKSDDGGSDLIEDESYEFDDSKFELIKPVEESAVIDLGDI